MLLVSGTLGILVITGVSFSLQRTGVTAGLAAILMGQLLVGLIADSTGLGGVDPIPFEFRRVLGLGVMALAVYLLLPRT
jgi:transporter family-2 protein